MMKSDAVKIFGGTQVELARALGVTKARISQWPKELEPCQADRVLVAAIRTGRLPPEALLADVQQAQRELHFGR